MYLLIGLTDEDKRKIRELAEARRSGGCQKTRENTREKTEDKIADFLLAHPKATQVDLVNFTGLSVKGVEWNLKNSRRRGVCAASGPTGGGRWEVCGASNTRGI